MNVAVTVRWNFFDNVGPDRAARLLAWTHFDQILARLLHEPVASYDWEQAYSANLPNCHRASFVLRVAPELYDAFFNSPAGYRGQYAASETIGETANRKILDALEASLLNFVDTSLASRPANIVQSLRAKQAKVWIVETEVEEQLQADAPSIDYPSWDFNTPNGQGLRAPLGTLLEVKGGWLDSRDNECLDPTKLHRSSFIHKTGDSK